MNDEEGHLSSEDGGSTSSSEDELLLMACSNLIWTQEFIAQIAPIPIFSMYFDNYFLNAPKREGGESGEQWVQRTLAHDNSCYNMFRVEPALFNRLHNTLVQSHGLPSTSRMSSLWDLAMFLWIVGAPQSIRHAKDHFLRSMKTISRTFGKVLTSILKLAADIIKPKDPEFSTVHPHLGNPEFSPHFYN